MIVLLVIITILIALALRGVAIMLLWNWLLPSLVHVPHISFLEGVGLYLLVTFLTGSIVDKNVLPKAKIKAANQG